MQVPGRDPGAEKGLQWKPGMTQIKSVVDVNFSALTKVPLLCLMFMGGRYRDSELFATWLQT